MAREKASRITHNKNMKDKKILIAGIILIIVIAVGTALYFFIAKDEAMLNHDLSKKENTEEQNLMQANQEALAKAQESGSTLRPADETDHIWGDLNAPVKMVVYSDFECPFCYDFHSTTQEIKDEFGDRVAVIFRHYFLSSHSNALLAAQASECAGEQDKFWPMYDKLFEDGRAGNLNMEEFKQDAEDLGLNQAKFNKCLDEEKYRDKILAQKQEGKEAGVIGTPTIFVGNEIYPGAYPFTDFTDSRGREVEGMRSVIERQLGIVD